MAKNPKHKESHAAPAASRTPFRFLFIAALIAAAALAALCGRLILRQRALLDREGELDRQTGQLEQEADRLEQEADRLEQELDRLAQELEDRRLECERQQKELDERQARLDEARDTIDFLSQYSLVAPGGEAPGYTALFPDFYAPEWDGETVDGGRVCCLTFDDGPSPNTDRVLQILDRYGVKATFFVVGTSASSAAGQERMRQIVAAGHTIAMHSWSHDYKKVYASVEAFLEEFCQLYQLIHEVTGVYPAIFRFPGGSINSYDRGVYQEIIAEMTRRGFVYYDWNASAGDATVTPGAPSALAANCLRGIGYDLAVVLAHDSAARTTTVDALPAVIEGYQAAGYTFSALHPGVRPVTMGYPKMR